MNDGGAMPPTREAIKDDGGAKTNAISHVSPNKAHVIVVRVVNLMYSSVSFSLLCAYYAAQYSCTSIMLLDSGNANIYNTVVKARFWGL